MTNNDLNENYDVDFVFPFVDSADPVWQKTAIKVHKKYGRTFNPNSQRFREWDNIVFIFRGIEKFCPWIRKIHLIVACPSQVPSFLKTECEKLNIIYHKDFIPREKRPTFNSCTIESCMPYIFTKDPELLRQFNRGPIDIAEHIIYSNDDLFFTGPMEKSDFFRGGYPCLHFRKVAYNSSQNLVRHQCFNSQNMVAKDFKVFCNGFIFKNTHSMVPMLGSTIKKVFNIHKDEMMDSMTQFREPHNVNQYIYSDYQYMSGEFYDHVFPNQYVSFQDFGIEQICEMIEHSADGRNGKCSDGKDKGYCLCINDSGSGTKFQLYKRRIRQSFSRILPDKCSCEW